MEIVVVALVLVFVVFGIATLVIVRRKAHARPPTPIHGGEGPESFDDIGRSDGWS